MFFPILRRFIVNERLIVSLDFILKVLLAYLLWKAFHYWVSTAGHSGYYTFIQFNNWLAAKTIISASAILNLLGYHILHSSRNIFISGSPPGLYVANHCLGIPPAIIFSMFIIAYQGKWIHKLWYIPVGIFCIYAINVLRIVALGVTLDCCYNLFFELAHSWVYLLLSYGMFFLLVTTWMNRFSKK